MTKKIWNLFVDISRREFFFVSSVKLRLVTFNDSRYGLKMMVCKKNSKNRIFEIGKSYYRPSTCPLNFMLTSLLVNKTIRNKLNNNKINSVCKFAIPQPRLLCELRNEVFVLFETDYTPNCQCLVPDGLSFS